jgi:putative transposase
MARRETDLVAGGTYHLYNRGVNRGRIFFERENYRFFLRGLRRYLGVPQETAVVAYCLTPTHFHLVVRPQTETLSRQMQRFGISYSKAINRRFGRVGPLFQGNFGAKLVDRDEYLVHLSRYVHWNPVAAGLVADPADWEFSSYRDYVGLRHGTLPSADLVLSHFPSPAAYRAYVWEEWDGDTRAIAHLLFDE